MNKTAQKQRTTERLAAGLCITCGKARDHAGNDGATASRCAPCASYWRDAAKASYQRHRDRIVAERRERDTQRRDSHLCPVCGKPLPRADAAAGFINCEPCRIKTRVRQHACERRQRPNKRVASLLGGDPLHVGHGAKPVNAVKKISFSVDMGAYVAIQILKARALDTKRARAAPGERVHIYFEVARIIRDAILFWEPKRMAAPVRTPSYRKWIDCRYGLHVDARTLAVIERHAPARGGNISATVCDLIAATANYRPMVIATGGKREWLKAEGRLS